MLGVHGSQAPIHLILSVRARPSLTALFPTCRRWTESSAMDGPDAILDRVSLSASSRESSVSDISLLHSSNALRIEIFDQDAMVYDYALPSSVRPSRRLAVDSRPTALGL